MSAAETKNVKKLFNIADSLFTTLSDNLTKTNNSLLEPINIITTILNMNNLSDSSKLVNVLNSLTNQMANINTLLNSLRSVSENLKTTIQNEITSLENKNENFKNLFTNNPIDKIKQKYNSICDSLNFYPTYENTEIPINIDDEANNFIGSINNNITTYSGQIETILDEIGNYENDSSIVYKIDFANTAIQSIEITSHKDINEKKQQLITLLNNRPSQPDEEYTNQIRFILLNIYQNINNLKSELNNTNSIMEENKENLKGIKNDLNVATIDIANILNTNNTQCKEIIKTFDNLFDVLRDYIHNKAKSEF